MQTSKYARSPAVLAGLQQLYVSGFVRIPVDGVSGLSPYNNWLVGWMVGWTCLKSLLLSDHMLVYMQALL